MTLDFKPIGERIWLQPTLLHILYKYTSPWLGVPHYLTPRLSNSRKDRFASFLLKLLALDQQRSHTGILNISLQCFKFSERPNRIFTEPNRYRYSRKKNYRTEPIPNLPILPNLPNLPNLPKLQKLPILTNTNFGQFRLSFG